MAATVSQSRAGELHDSPRQLTTSVLIQKFLSTLSLDGEGAAAEPFDGREDIIGGFGPAERLGVGIAGIDIGGDGRFQFLGGAVGTALDLVLAEKREEPLHLVDPGRGGGREVGVPAGPLGETSRGSAWSCGWRHCPG